MDRIPTGSLIPAACAVLFAFALLLLARRYHWADSEPSASQPKAEPEKTQNGDFKSRIRFFILAHRWEFLLALTVLGVMLFAGLSAPVQLTGEIPAAPKMPGRPFYFIHWQRNHLLLFYNQTASVSNILTGLMAFTLTVFAALRKSPRMANAGLLWGFMSLAGGAQWMLSDGRQLSFGIALYLFAGAGFLVWSLLNLKTLGADIDEARPIPFHWEITLVAAFIALAAFARLYALGSVPYGIEGDEAKWTAEVVSLGLRGDPDLNGMYHRDSLPVSFFMQTLFHKLLEPSLFAARFEVAVFSILATIIFYLLLRQVTAMPLALLAAWLLSASIFDISASRLANVESHVKIWPILTLALFAWALRKKHWAVYAISGIALALGLLTYDTVLPIGIVMVLLVIYEARRNGDTFGDTLRNLMALLTPALLTLPFLIPYLSGRLSYYNIDQKGWDGGAATLWNHFSDVIVSWYVRSFEDFIYNRQGPLLNAFLLPWLTLGFAASLAASRRRLPFWTLAWSLLFILPVPIATHSPLGRVYYPALPAVYILAALGMYVFTRESLRALGRGFRPFVAAISIAILAWLPLFNLYIYFNEVIDFSDRQMRREVAEFAGEAANPDNLIVLASVPRANEALNNEYQMIELFMLKNLPIEDVAYAYINIPLEEVLPRLHDISPRMNRSIILDKFTQNDRQKRDDLTNALRLCYPQAEWTEGRFFDRVDIDAESLANPACISTNLSLTQASSDTFTWSLSQGAANRIVFDCERLLVERDWVEAESLFLSNGWQVETSFTTGWNGDGFIMDNYGSSPFVFNVRKLETNPVYVWVRYYKRAPDNSPAELTLNGQTRKFSAVNGDKLNQWVWERVGPFPGSAGDSTASIARPYRDDPSQFIALFIDSLALTHNPDFSPADDQSQPLPPRLFRTQTESGQGTFTVRFEPGSYRCSISAFSERDWLVDAFGFAPLKSGIIEFTVE